MASFGKVPRDSLQSGQASFATVIRTAVTRELVRNFLRATALVENSLNLILQFGQFVAVSGEDALQREHVCTAELLNF